MNLQHILPAVARIHGNLIPVELRARTYLSTYDAIRHFATAPGPITPLRFHALATMVYGWMPRVVRIDANYTTPATALLNAATKTAAHMVRGLPIFQLANCLKSVVGASKMLHFMNDAVFPIWDSKIESFRQGKAVSHAHMGQLANYLAYVDDVHAICGDTAFPAFAANFRNATNARFAALGIAPYPISDVRVAEAAAFELA